jgi:hypothetical protein
MTDEQFAEIIQYLSWIDSHGYVIKYQFLILFDLLTFILGVLLGAVFGRGIITWLSKN